MVGQTSPTLLNLFNDIFHRGEIPPSASMAYIKIMAKPGKDALVQGSYRPIFEEWRKTGIHTISKLIHKEARWYFLPQLTKEYVLSKFHYLQYFQLRSAIFDLLRNLLVEIHQNKCDEWVLSEIPFSKNGGIDLWTLNEGQTDLFHGLWECSISQSYWTEVGKIVQKIWPSATKLMPMLAIYYFYQEKYPDIMVT